MNDLRRQPERYSVDFSELAEFGLAADELLQPSLAEGGFLTLGNRTPRIISQGEEQSGHDGQRQRPQEAGPAARPRQGRRTSSRAASSAAHPVERGLSAELGLDELFTWHPDARWVGGSSGYALLLIPLGLFSSIPERAYLILEIPTQRPEWLRGTPAGYAPFIRAWAYWANGALARAHHKYPDESMCACQERNWLLGREVLEDYVGYCACWVAKLLHERLLGWW